MKLSGAILLLAVMSSDISCHKVAYKADEMDNVLEGIIAGKATH